MSATKVTINPSERFPHLPRAPIVEAVIEIRTLAHIGWEESALRAHFEPRLNGYRWLDSQHEFLSELNIQAGQTPIQKVKELGLKGVRFESQNGLHIAQFNRDGFVFSRLQPYDNWAQLAREALRLWTFHSEYAQPTTADRLGLRFINRIVLPVLEHHLDTYIRSTPAGPADLNLPLSNFMHQETFAVPGYPYAIHLVRTIQIPSNPQTEGFAIILDIDAFTKEPFEIASGSIERRLDEMRWLKNKMFFSSVTEKAMELFQ